MLRLIDNLLNRITMYRLVLYVLIALLVSALALSSVHALAFNPFALIFSTAFILAVCAGSNWVFSRVFGVPTNEESATISALILALIITPLQSYNDLWFLGWASVLAMASKYIVAIKGKHLFNPVAFAVALTYFATNQSASWWVGSASMLPLTLIGGFLIVRKLRRFDMVFSFLGAPCWLFLIASIFTSASLFATLQGVLLYSPLIFFASILLTEPLTAPPTRKLRIYYGALIGVLFAPLLHIGSLYTTPELALLIGNVMAYMVSPKEKLVLRLKSRTRISPDTYEFIFTPKTKLAFAPGQYMEWTLGLNDPDTRGNRRSFTLASAPTERDLRLGVKVYQKSSAFKKALLAMDGSQDIVATQLAGDFVLPDSPSQKCVFIAGGIGVTPFRSMIKFLLDTHERRPILLFYSNRNAEDILYKDVFDRAEKELGIKTIYTITDTTHVPPTWKGGVGRFTPQMIQKVVPNYRRVIFYISGPTEMVDTFKDSLKQIGVKDEAIKTDFFTGL